MSDSEKIVRVGSRTVTVDTLGPSDRYFPHVKDGYGPEFVRFCERNIKSDSVLLDIGANIGLTSIIAAQYAGTVHAFEPHPKVYPLLAKNIEANGLTNVTPHELAISSKPGRLKFIGGSAFGRIDEKNGTVEVEVETLDAVVARLGLTRLDAIKVDVEGFEPHVLEGAKETLRRFRPLIYMEFNSWCLMSHARMNPIEFSEALFDGFESVLLANNTAEGVEPISDAAKLVHSNIKLHGSVSDVVLSGPRGAMIT